jgi:sugar phosphate isomerase/epimerase
MPMIPVWLTDTVTNDLDRALHYTLLWGLEGVELRTLGGPSDRVPFVNEARLKKRMAEQDVPVTAVVPGMFEGPATERGGWMNEVAMLEETLQFCRRIGCPRVVTSVFAAEEGESGDLAAAALRRAGTAAERYGVVLAVLNEDGMARATGGAVAALLDAVGLPNVQAAWSPAVAFRAGEDPEEGLAALGARIALVRYADGRMKSGAWEATLPGEGALDWPRHLQRLHAQGFDGPVSLEVDLEPHALQGARAAYQLVTMLRKAQAAGR